VSGYVVCRSCGTRIKAGRAFCLKCFEPLPEPGQAEPTTLWESVGLSPLQQAAFAIVAGLVIIALVAFIWQTRPVPLDDEARPIARRADPVPPKAAQAAPPPATLAIPAGGSAVEPFVPTSLAPAPVATVNPADVPELEATLAAYDKQIPQRSEDADLMNRKGQVLERLGRAGEAVTWYERAAVLAPDTRSYHANVARVYLALGQLDPAIAAYRELVRLQPGDYAARNTLAMSLQRKGDDEAAIPEFQAAAALGPAESSVHLGLGVSLERVGRVPEAVKEYQRYVAMRPSSADGERLKEHLAALGAGVK
jgi:tetratricopeptide (TPR) repeat protein